MQDFHTTNSSYILESIIANEIEVNLYVTYNWRKLAL